MKVPESTGFWIVHEIAEIFPNRELLTENEHFQGFDSAASFYKLENITLFELRGKFNMEELLYLTKCFNGSIYNLNLDVPEKLLFRSVVDCANFEMQFDGIENLLDKIKTLTNFQSHTLIRFVQAAILGGKLSENLQILI